MCLVLRGWEIPREDFRGDLRNKGGVDLVVLQKGVEPGTTVSTTRYEVVQYLDIAPSVLFS